MCKPIYTSTMLSVWIAAFCLSTVYFCKAQEVPGLPAVPNPNARNKTAVLKESFTKSVAYCSSMHKTDMIQAIAMFSLRESSDKEGKCFLHCMLQRYRLMDKSGSFNQDKFKPFMDYIPVSNFLKTIKGNLQGCMQESSGISEPCDKAYKFTRCFYSKGAAKPAPGNPNQEVLPAEGF